MAFDVPSGLEEFEPRLPEAAEPLVLPVPHGAVKVLPRWAESDEVIRWRLKYRCAEPGEPDRTGSLSRGDGGYKWTEVELRSFTRELPVSGLPCGKRHYFKVALETPDGWSEWSRMVSCEPTIPQPPGKCAAVFAVVKDETTAMVRWTRPGDVAIGAPEGSEGHIRRYRLLATWRPQRQEDQVETCHREITIEQDTDHYEVQDLTFEREYQFQVAAESSMGWGAYSDASPVLVMPPPVPPRLPPPTLRRATHHTMIVQWRHPGEGTPPVLSYRFRYTTSEDWSHDVQEIQGVSPILVQHTVDGLRPGQRYIFQVRGLNRHGMSIWSADSMPLKTLEPTEPSKVEGLTAPQVYKSWIMLQWPPASANGAEVAEYRLRQAHRPDMSDAIEVMLTVVRKGNFDTCELRHLLKDQYFFQVASANKHGLSQWSDPLAIDLAVPFSLEDA